MLQPQLESPELSTETSPDSPGHHALRRAVSAHSSQSSSTTTTTSSTSFQSHDWLPLHADEKTHRQSFSQRASAQFAKALQPRRRSSAPLLQHIARKKSTQLALVAGILFLGALIWRECRWHDEMPRLWDRELMLRDWDVGHKRDREVKLVTLREDYMDRRQEGELTRRGQGDATGTPFQSQAWTSKEEDLLNENAAKFWPEWWGNPDAVGPSPFDYKPVSLPPWKEKKRLLMLTDYSDYLERMNTHTYEIVDAAHRHPNIIVDVWGPGWAGYDKAVPLSTNIRKRAHRLSQLEKGTSMIGLEGEGLEVKEQPESGMQRKPQVAWTKPEWLDDVPEECSDVRFDVVLTISNIYEETDPHLDVLDCGALMVQQLGDCHSLRCTYEWYPQINNITLSKYAFELPELFSYGQVKERYPEWEMGLFGHSPDTANEWDFYPIPWNEKTRDAKIFGFDGSFYPIRTTVTNYLREIASSSEKSIISRHPHPGYTVSVPQDARDSPLETYEADHRYYKTHIKLREDFAKGMRESRICVFDASLERKLIRKYAQAFLSGCVVASDIPTEHESALSRFVIPLKPEWPIERINDALQHYLDRPDVLQQMAVDALVYARQHLTSTSKISHIMEMADHYRDGARGYEFPHGFSMKCRAYWSDEAGYRPPWC